jgi:hypothetical protein
VKGYKRKLEEVTFQEQATKRKPQRSKKGQRGSEETNKVASFVEKNSKNLTNLKKGKLLTVTRVANHS